MYSIAVITITNSKEIYNKKKYRIVLAKFPVLIFPRILCTSTIINTAAVGYGLKVNVEKIELKDKQS